MDRHPQGISQGVHVSGSHSLQIVRSVKLFPVKRSVSNQLGTSSRVGQSLVAFRSILR